MPKRRIYLVLLILAVAGMVGLIVAGAFREREPEYGGKRLSEWVIGYGPRSQRVDSPWPWPNNEQTDEAIRHIGTNALPHLLRWIGYETPTWKAKFYASANAVLRRLKPSWHLRDDRQVLLARGSINALFALWPVSESAVGALTALVNRPHGTKSAARAAIALVALGQPVDCSRPELNDGIWQEVGPHVSPPASYIIPFLRTPLSVLSTNGAAVRRPTPGRTPMF